MIRSKKLIGNLILSAFPIEIERLIDFFLCGCLVDADVSDTSQQREIDGASHILLVVRHQLQQGGIVITDDGHHPIVLFDESHGLVHLVRGESRLHTTQVEFADQAPGHCIAV